MVFHWGECPAWAERGERQAVRDENLRLKEEISQLKSQLVLARENEIRSVTRVADWLAVKFMREPIYSPVESAMLAPDIPMPAPVGKMKRQARDIVREKTEEAEREILAWREAQMKKAAAVAEMDPRGELGSNV